MRVDLMRARNAARSLREIACAADPTIHAGGLLAKRCGQAQCFLARSDGPACRQAPAQEHAMKPGLALIAAAAALAAVASAHASPRGADALGATLYQLVDAAPLASLAQPGRDWRIESAVHVGGGHQLRLSSSAARLTPPPGAGFAPSLRLDPARATWRYAVLAQPSWVLRAGLTTNLGDLRGGHLAAPGERARFGTLPLLHVGGEGALAQRWLLGFDADGLMTARGRAFELGLRVSYQLAPNFALYGGYRLSDAGGEAEEAYAPGFSNSANLGLRLRF
jgi:hypothetical protein